MVPQQHNLFKKKYEMMWKQADINYRQVTRK